MNTFSSRRFFIRHLVASALAAPLASRAAVKPGTRVVVVGAGAAGLAAARTLNDAGCTVTVLEARNRIGGRVVTDHSTFGCPVEMGAQFIHGRSNKQALNPIWDLAVKQGWATVPFSADSGQTYRGGLPLTDAQDTAFTNLGTAFLDWVVNVLKESVLDDTNTTYSMENAVRQFAAARHLTAQQVVDLRAYLAIEIEGDYAGNLSRISVVAYDEDSQFEVGGDQSITGGYDQLPAFLAQGLNVITGCVVRSIAYGSRPLSVVTNKGAYACDYVVVTVPLGVLKKGAITFAPALPAAKQTAIARMSMGLLDKVILQFPVRFWPHGNWFADIEGSNPYGLTFSTQEVANPGSNILVAWQFGQLGVQREALTDAALVSLVMTEVRRCFKGIAVPNPVKTLITRWSQDPYSYGSYSFPCTGSPRSDIGVLAAPVSKAIYFAGEATNADYFGTVHGAYLSGLREAANVIAAAQMVTQ